MTTADTLKVSRPRLAAGLRNVVRSSDSASLWNCTLSPGTRVVLRNFDLFEHTRLGWTQEEVEVLRLALMKFGVGNWSAIIQSGSLPGKTVAQLNNQTQRMLGQQSTAGMLECLNAGLFFLSRIPRIRQSTY